jgi:hypothetical protein
MGRLGMERDESSVPKRRSQADKVGKHKYEIQRFDRLDARMERIEWMLRTVFHGLEGYFRFERPLVEKIACQSDMELAIVSLIFEAGPNGVLAKEIQARLPQLNLEKHKILRIVNRANRNVEKTFGQVIIEKRGKKWAFTEFGVEIWGKTEKDDEG